MGRFLFVVPPLAGHVNPTISVGRVLERRGHEVAWCGLPGLVEQLLPEDACFLPAGSAGAGEAAVELRQRSRTLRAAAAFKFLWESVLVPLGEAMVDGVDDAVTQWAPDVIVADQQTLAGPLVARRRGVRWVTSATTSAELVDALAPIPRAKEWVEDQVVRLQDAVGVPADQRATASDLRFSPHLVLVFSSRHLVGDTARPGEGDGDPPWPTEAMAFVGPSISDRPETLPFPWQWLDHDVPRILVTLGTVNTDAGERFFRATVDALADEPLQAVLVAPPELFADTGLPANVVVQERVPQLALLRHVDAVVCHGGHNTVCEALAHGLPLVLAPIRDDQPVVAEQVVRAGAGVRVRFGRVTPGDLRKAVRTVLDEPEHRRAAHEIRRSFDAAGGATAAADRLESLACAD
jgi:UDP:flavonoid glycosyltransferase YjiC (YdhE family)